MVDVQVEFVGDRENIDGAKGSSLLPREYMDAAIVEDEDGVRRRGIAMLSVVCFPSFMLGNYSLNSELERREDIRCVAAGRAVTFEKAWKDK